MRHGISDNRDTKHIRPFDRILRLHGSGKTALRCHSIGTPLAMAWWSSEIFHYFTNGYTIDTKILKRECGATDAAYPNIIGSALGSI
jgi:hypothetical protein